MVPLTTHAWAASQHLTMTLKLKTQHNKLKLKWKGDRGGSKTPHIRGYHYFPRSGLLSAAILYMMWQDQTCQVWPGWPGTLHLCILINMQENNCRCGNLTPLCGPYKS